MGEITHCEAISLRVSTVTDPCKRRLLQPDLEHRSPRKENKDPGIIVWSLDHHVLRVPLYRSPNGGGSLSIYESHKDMLDKYWDFHPPKDAAKHVRL